jgi:hypothetical protein
MFIRVLDVCILHVFLQTSYNIVYIEPDPSQGDQSFLVSLKDPDGEIARPR